MTTNSPTQQQLEIDKRFKQLIIEALEYSPGSLQRNQKVTGFLVLVEHLPNSLTKEKIGNLSPYYDDALKVTENDIARNLDRFVKDYDFNIREVDATDVRVCFVRWYNKILKCDCIDKWRQWKKIPPPTSLDNNIGEDGSSTLADIVADTKNPPPMEKAEFDENWRQKELLFKYIQEDPDGRLRNCQSKKHPQLTCWELCKRRLLKEPPETLEAIAEALGIKSLQTVNAHWRRNCLPLLQEIAKKFGFDGV